MQAAPGYPGPAGPIDARPRIGEWLSEAFTLFGREWLTWVLITLIYFVILSVPIIIGYVAIFVVVFAAVGVGAAAGGDASGAGAGAATAILMTIVGGLVLGLLVLAVNAYLHAGLVRTAVKQLRGETIQVGDLFSAGDVYLPAMITEILRALGVWVGTMLCIVPGYLAAGVWIFAQPLTVERRLPPMDSLRTSWEATRPHMWMYLVWFLLYALIISAGSIIAIGVLATYPIGHLMIMVSYRDVFGIPGAVPPVTAGMVGQPVGGYGAPGQYPTQPGGYGAPPPGGPTAP